MCAVELCGLIHCSFIHQQRSPWEEGIINESNLQWRLVVDQWAKSLSLLIYTRYTPLVIVPFSSLGPASHFSRTACFSQNGDPVACPLALSSSPSIHDSNWWCRARSSAQLWLYTHTLTARVALPICGVLRLQNWSLDWDGILHYDMPVLEILFFFFVFLSPFFNFYLK